MLAALLGFVKGIIDLVFETFKKVFVALFLLILGIILAIAGLTAFLVHAAR